MKRYSQFILIILVTTFFSCKKDTVENPPPPPPPEDFFIRGADLSFTPEISEYNISYSEGDSVKPILQIMKDKGINTVRLRLWYHPSTIHSSLSEVLSFAQQIKSYGLKFWLDIHYSDTWADPGKQYPPSAWYGLTFDQLSDSVYAYTKNTMTVLSQNGVTPEFVQVGNETNNGMLWPFGEIYTNSTTNWVGFRTLVEQAVTAIKEVSPTTQVMVHYAGLAGASYYFQNLLPMSPDIDMIGLSYYPQYHGKNIDSVRIVVNALVTAFHKPVVIAETSYPWTLGWNDYTNNFIWTLSQTIPAYTPTDTGQAHFFGKMLSIMHGEANDSNFGLCYWAPDWVAFKGPTSTDGSAWENQTLFDFQNKALPALDTLGKK